MPFTSFDSKPRSVENNTEESNEFENWEQENDKWMLIIWWLKLRF